MKVHSIRDILRTIHGRGGPTKAYLLSLASLLLQRASSRLEPEQIMGDDEALLDAFTSLSSEDAIEMRLMASCYDGQLALIGLPRWAQCGFPEIQLPETYAAGLLVSVVAEDVVPLVRAPFPAFLLEVPNGLLTLDTPEGIPTPIRWVMVLRNEALEKWAYVAWSASEACMWRFGVRTADLLPGGFGHHDQTVTEHVLFPIEVTDRDQRVATLLGRLIVNVCLAMSDPRQIRTEPKPAKRGRSSERGRRPPGVLPKTQIYRLGKPIEHDFRGAIRDYVEGKRRRIEVQTLVAGHWKMQPHGPANSLRKLIYVEPYWRGELDAPVLVRPTRVSGKSS